MRGIKRVFEKYKYMKACLTPANDEVAGNDNRIDRNMQMFVDKDRSVTFIGGDSVGRDKNVNSGLSSVNLILLLGAILFVFVVSSQQRA